MVQQIDRRKEGWADPRLDGRLEEYTYGRTVGAPAEWSGGKPCRGAAGKRRGGEGRGGEGRRRRGEVASLARKNGGKKGFSTVSCKAMEAAENPPSVTPGHGRPLPMSRGGTALSPGQWISRRRDRHFGRGHGDLHAARRLTRHQIPNHPPFLHTMDSITSHLDPDLGPLGVSPPVPAISVGAVVRRYRHRL